MEFSQRCRAEVFLSKHRTNFRCKTERLKTQSGGIQNETLDGGGAFNSDP